jgi:tRNA-dihydrouridine synthase B
MEVCGINRMMAASQPLFTIGPIPIHGDVILAPMEGFSDVPYRSLCRKFGSAMSYTSFVSALELTQGIERAWKELDYLPHERPVVFQFYDEDLDRLIQAAKDSLPRQPDIIDINMGCSSRRVSGRGAGAGLLREPKKVAALMQELTTQLDLPITAKIRLGWDEDTRNFIDIGRIIEDNGGAAIAVHGRTRQQAYRGRADWDAIAELRQAISIPIIANGDVIDPAGVEQLMQHTQCQAVMVGRGAIGNPWIFQKRYRHQIGWEETVAVISQHLNAMIDYYGPRGTVLFRKHLTRYLEPFEVDDAWKRQLLTQNSYQQVLEQLATFQPQITLTGEAVGI